MVAGRVRFPSKRQKILKSYKMKTIFCDTTDVRSEIKRLLEFQSNNWIGFEGDQNTFAELQGKILPEINYLKDFWDNQIVNDKKFWAWSCLSAYDDTPAKNRIYCNRERKCRIDHIDKYDVLHDRERYLGDLNREIFGLFHSWQFITQGWTAY